MSAGAQVDILSPHAAEMDAGAAQVDPPQNSSKDEELWRGFAATRIVMWEDGVRVMLSQLDRKLRKTVNMLSKYQSEVARTLRNAMLKNLNTQSVLLSIIDFRQRALIEDVLTQLYDALLELCTLNLVDVAALLGCPVSSPYVTYRVMQLVNGTVQSRKTWLTKEFDSRKTWVVHTIAELNATYDVLVPVPLRRSASLYVGSTQRGAEARAAPLSMLDAATTAATAAAVSNPLVPEVSSTSETSRSQPALRSSYEYSMGHYRSRAKTSQDLRRDMLGEPSCMPGSNVDEDCSSCSRTVVEMFRALDEVEGRRQRQPTVPE